MYLDTALKTQAKSFLPICAQSGGNTQEKKLYDRVCTGLKCHLLPLTELIILTYNVAYF